jgi:hypothetical protein
MLARPSLLKLSAFFGVLLLGLLVPGSARSNPGLCIAGETYGEWDLPSGAGDTGQVNGVLVVDPEEPLFYLEATLTEGPPPMEFRLGQITGMLTDSSGTPVYGVEGGWRTIPRSDTEGMWRAVIYQLDTGEPVGKMHGTFTQPLGKDGEYQGEWVICDHPDK